MSKGREIRCYDYVNHPYERVREALTKDPLAVFQSATKAAASRARSVGSQLRVDFGGIAVQTDIRISVKKIEEKTPVMSSPTTHLRLEWEADKMPRIFPLMRGEIQIYALTATETQLDFSGFYEPPLGPLGKIADAAVGHLIAEVSVHRFVNEVAEYLRQSLAQP